MQQGAWSSTHPPALSLKPVDRAHITFARRSTSLPFHAPPSCGAPAPSYSFLFQDWHDKGFRLHWDPVRRRFTILNVSRRSFVLRGGSSSLATGEKRSCCLLSSLQAGMKLVPFVWRYIEWLRGPYVGAAVERVPRKSRSPGTVACHPKTSTRLRRNSVAKQLESSPPPHADFSATHHSVFL